MSEGLIGAVIGGLLTGIGTLLVELSNFKRWKTEQRIRILEDKKRDLEELSRSTLNRLPEDLATGIVSAEIVSDIDFLFPDNVRKLFYDYHGQNSRVINAKTFYFDIAREMKCSIKKINDQIEKLL